MYTLRYDAKFFSNISAHYCFSATGCLSSLTNMYILFTPIGDEQTVTGWIRSSPVFNCFWADITTPVILAIGTTFLLLMIDFYIILLLFSMIPTCSMLIKNLKLACNLFNDPWITFHISIWNYWECNKRVVSIIANSCIALKRYHQPSCTFLLSYLGSFESTSYVALMFC